MSKLDKKQRYNLVISKRTNLLVSSTMHLIVLDDKLLHPSKSPDFDYFFGRNLVTKND